MTQQSKFSLCQQIFVAVFKTLKKINNNKQPNKQTKTRKSNTTTRDKHEKR